MRELIKKINCLFFFIGLLAGPLFGVGSENLKTPQAVKKSAKNVINMQEYYDNLSEMVPAVIFLSPDCTTGVSDEMLENFFTELKLQMVLNSYFKPVSMAKFLDGKYTEKKERNLFQFFYGIKGERYQVNLRGILKPKIFKCGNNYIVYIALLPFDSSGYPITSLRIIKTEREMKDAVANCLFELNSLMQKHNSGKVKLAVNPFEISCRTLVEQKTGEFDFIKTSFSNQEGIELKETDDMFSYILAHQATATGLYSATPLGMIPEYVTGKSTSASISAQADYLINTKLVLSDKMNVITLSLIKADSGVLVKTAKFFTKRLDIDEIWEFTNYFLAEITKSIYSEKNYRLLSDISIKGKAFYKDGMFIGWDSIGNFPIPAEKTIINTGTMATSDINNNPNNYYSNKNDDLFVFVNNDEVKIFRGREGAYVWNLLEK
ncbi:MAG: hypothetical protein IJ530_10565 [Treponema sp.]|uniref:hypothetical protein n=1 Tax=Treponema sp. TaxID=166 RepID=UPI0025EFFD9C|nr:hypothetical protein [Treponema sp.]MBQ8680189.1 hypothetical protein [Treponema sp.]